MPDDNPFAILGIEPTFAIDPARLQQRFLKLSAEHHPDRFQDPLDQADAADRVAAVNRAYHQLRDDEARANALLTVLGGPGPSDNKDLPPDLLMEMMEIRERQEQAVQMGDQGALDELRDWARGERTQRLARIADLFDQADDQADDQRDAALLARIRLELNALRYVERMIEQLP